MVDQPKLIWDLFGNYSWTSEVRKLGEVAVWKGPDPAILPILPASCSLDSFENRMSGLYRALFKKGDSNEVISPMKLNRKPLIKYCSVWSQFALGTVQTVPFLRGFSLCMQDVCFVVKIQYTKKCPEKYFSSLISLQWVFNVLVCLQKFSFTFHKSLHKSLQLLLLKFRRKSCQCVADACIFDNPLSKNGVCRVLEI